MIDYEAAIFSPEDAIDYAIARLIRLNLINHVLVRIQPHCAVLQGHKDAVFVLESRVLHLDYRTDLRRHGDAPAFLAFQVKALERIVHSSYHNLLLKLDDANRLRFNCDFSL